MEHAYLGGGLGKDLQAHADTEGGAASSHALHEHALQLSSAQQLQRGTERTHTRQHDKRCILDHLEG